ncbi:unnamed protein product [Paramecium pentaurelia]|uniref:USP domain-containing protein n=1 Tax=Paramecium pentaurelia TaxID=43138 RepID=A0A8S1Y7N4_9CILI|nr:unnamed protein product [Paramecium pentaurelia]
MDKIIASATSVKEKLKALEQSYKVLNQQEIEGVYKHIHTLGEDSLVLLDQAQKINFGYIFNDLQLFKRVSESIRELDQICMYLKYIDRNYVQKAYLKELGFQSEKLIMEFRQKGNILQKMHLDTQDLKIQRQMIEMIIKLCPKDLSFNPELFQLMLIPFKCYQQLNPKDNDLLDNLASVLLQQCNGQGQANQNQVHDWLVLISGIIQHAYEGNTQGLHILLKKISQDYLSELLIRHKNYMLDNYFKNSQDTIKIFQGLVSHTICQEAIFIIKTVSQMFYNIVKDQNNSYYLDILREVYKEFILTKILENLQMISLAIDILDLLLFYIIGMSQIDNESFLRSINLMINSLTLTASLRFQSRDFITPRYQFLQIIRQNYHSLNQIEEFQRIYTIFKEKSFEQTKYISQSNYQSWEFQNLKNQSTNNYSLQQRDSKDFVGLENLTNTCFMNSILQSLYMTESFRKFVLQMQFPDSNLQFTPQTLKWSCLQKLFTQLTYQNQGYCSPYELKRSLRQPYSNTNDQQDVGEFVHHFLEDLFNETQNEAFKTTIGNLFFGYQRQIIKCYNCVKPQPNYGQKEKFLGIDLHFNKLNDINIISMIKKAYEEEQIEFTCERCRQKTNKIYKSQQLLQLPSVLFMTLHRFTYDQNSQTMTKILDKVPFQFQIDFREAFPNKHLNSQDSVYNLYAFIVHLGKNSYSGHYICYARQLNKPDTWIAFDDTMISTFQYNSKQLDEELIAEEAPYLLFYQNQSGQPLIFNN